MDRSVLYTEKSRISRMRDGTRRGISWASRRLAIGSRHLCVYPLGFRPLYTSPMLSIFLFLSISASLHVRYDGGFCSPAFSHRSIGESENREALCSTARNCECFVGIMVFTFLCNEACGLMYWCHHRDATAVSSLNNRRIKCKILSQTQRILHVSENCVSNFCQRAQNNLISRAKEP